MKKLKSSMKLLLTQSQILRETYRVAQEALEKERQVQEALEKERQVQEALEKEKEEKSWWEW